jgi:hypothetical protein
MHSSAHLPFVFPNKHIQTSSPVPMVAAPGSKNVYTPIDPFFVDVRSPSSSQVIATLLDDDCDVLNFQGTPGPLPYT